MRYPFDDETPLTEEEKYLMSQEIEDINEEISPFDTYDIDKEEEYFNELIKTEPQMEVWDDNMESQKKWKW